MLKKIVGAAVVVTAFAAMPRAESPLMLKVHTGHGQVGYDRPFRGAGQYRTPVDGLYLCGSSSHPGGNVTGLPGYNAAQVLLADLGLAELGPRH